MDCGSGETLMIIKWRIMNRNVAVVYKIHQIAKLRMLSLVGLLADSEYAESTPPGWFRHFTILSAGFAHPRSALCLEGTSKWEIDLPQPMQP
jgi:hypothetical protein